MIVEGNTSGSIKSVALEITGTLTCFGLYNKGGSAAVVSVGIVTPSTLTDRYIFNFNLAATGAATSSAYQETSITIPKGAKIFLVTSQSLDYYFVIN